MTSNNSWFVLTLYTPTPPEFTDDLTYQDEINNYTTKVELKAEYSYENEVCKSMADVTIEHSEYSLDDRYEYVVEDANYTYQNTTEVIRIER